jgi:hypothetical protein
MAGRQLTGRLDFPAGTTCGEFSGLLSDDGANIQGWYRCDGTVISGYGSWAVLSGTAP